MWSCTRVYALVLVSALVIWDHDNVTEVLTPEHSTSFGAGPKR